MIRTRVGYAGGHKQDPTYRDMGDHTETVQVDYDPRMISYEQLLRIFWDSHHPTTPPFSQQYKSIIFYHNEEQKRLAIETKEREESRLKGSIYTEIVPFSEFYLAEAYHQKHYLRQEPDIMKDLSGIVLVNERIPEDETLKKANDEAIPVLTSKLPTFELVGKLYTLLGEE